MQQGDVIEWEQVRDDMMVREIGGSHDGDFTVRHRGRGWLVFAKMAGVWRCAHDSAGTSWSEIENHAPTQAWENICAGMADSVLDMTDEEVEAELREQGIDPQEMAARGKALVERLLAERGSRKDGDA